MCVHSEATMNSVHGFPPHLELLAQMFGLNESEPGDFSGLYNGGLVNQLWASSWIFQVRGMAGVQMGLGLPSL